MSQNNERGWWGRRRLISKIGIVIGGSVGGLFVLFFAFAMVAVTQADKETRSERQAERTAEKAQERQQGFHCLTAGHHPGLMALVQQQLKDPGSLELHDTRIAPVVTTAAGDRGHGIVMEFGARNSFGGMARNTARGWIDHDTCTATLEWIR